MGTLVRRFLVLGCLTAGLVACNSARTAVKPPPVPAPTGGTMATGGSGGSVATGGSGGSGGSTGGTIGSSVDVGVALPPDAAPASAPDSAADMSMPAPADGGGSDGYPDSAFLTGRPDIRLCKKEWTAEQCCAFLGACLNSICKDSAKARNGLGDWMTWCPKLDDMGRRCHVYHCYISISPTGGINDHDSHCGHAANQVQGGGCPAEVYQ